LRAEGPLQLEASCIGPSLRSGRQREKEKSGPRAILEFRLPANLGPILLSYIFIDLDGNVTHVETILSVAARPGNPILNMCFDIVIVCSHVL